MRRSIVSTRLYEVRSHCDGVIVDIVRPLDVPKRSYWVCKHQQCSLRCCVAFHEVQKRMSKVTRGVYTAARYLTVYGNVSKVAFQSGVLACMLTPIFPKLARVPGCGVTKACRCERLVDVAV
jgi:hypothetical protein